MLCEYICVSYGAVWVNPVDLVPQHETPEVGGCMPCRQDCVRGGGEISGVSEAGAALGEDPVMVDDATASLQPVGRV